MQDGWDNTSQKDCTPRQESEARACETNKLEKDALPIMGLPAQTEKGYDGSFKPIEAQRKPNCN